jgi:hypothetical protein
MEDLPRLLQPRLRVGGSARGQGAAARAGQRLCFIQGTADLAGQVQGLPVTSLGRVSGSRAPAAGSSAGLVMLATLSARVVACRGRGQADDGLPGLRAELEDGAELGAADAGVITAPLPPNHTGLSDQCRKHRYQDSPADHSLTGPAAIVRLRIEAQMLLMVKLVLSAVFSKRTASTVY